MSDIELSFDKTSDDNVVNVKAVRKNKTEQDTELCMIDIFFGSLWQYACPEVKKK